MFCKAIVASSAPVPSHRKLGATELLGDLGLVAVQALNRPFLLQVVDSGCRVPLPVPCLFKVPTLNETPKPRSSRRLFGRVQRALHRDASAGESVARVLAEGGGAVSQRSCGAVGILG